MVCRSNKGITVVLFNWLKIALLFICILVYWLLSTLIVFIVFGGVVNVCRFFNWVKNKFNKNKGVKC
jgi:hypothetical protein